MITGDFKKINIRNHTCYYIDDIIYINDLGLDNILSDEILWKNILSYHIPYAVPKIYRLFVKNVDRIS